MKIAGIKLYRYTLPLTPPLIIGARQLEQREGIIVELCDDDGHPGFGETAPLIGFSPESLDEAEHQLIRLSRAIVGATIPENLEELSGGFDEWPKEHELSPAARFGFEAAMLSVIASRRDLPLERLLSDCPPQAIRLNALLTGSPAEIHSRAELLHRDGWTAFKLKVGREAVEHEIRLIHELRKVIGTETTLRLDANRRFSPDEFLRFAEGVHDCNIEYIEEPLPSLTELTAFAKSGRCLLPLALDESLKTLAPEELPEIPGLSALVLKPTMLGLERAARLARLAVGRGLSAVISSSYESTVGLTILARTAAAIDIGDTPAGLDTGGVFTVDLLSPLPVKGGEIRLDRLSDIATDIDRRLLEETVKV